MSQLLQQQWKEVRLLVVISMLLLLGTHGAATSKPPEDLLDGYSLKYVWYHSPALFTPYLNIIWFLAYAIYYRGAIPIEYFFVDDSNGTGTHYSYSDAYMKSLLEGAKRYKAKLENQLAHSDVASIKESDLSRLRVHKNDWIYVALMQHRHAIRGKLVVVIGSSEPRIETVALAFGASSVTTIEYNKLTYGNGTDIPVTTINADQFPEFYSNNIERFDVAISISSIEHDGLGRYGDPLNPNADLEAMKKIKDIVIPGGYFFVSVPIGPDVTVFNLHRRYGLIRLPMLTKGWSIVDRIPWNRERLTQKANWRQTYEPLLVLQKDAVPAPEHSKETSKCSNKKEDSIDLSMEL